MIGPEELTLTAKAITNMRGRAAITSGRVSTKSNFRFAPDCVHKLTRTRGSALSGTANSLDPISLPQLIARAHLQIDGDNSPAILLYNAHHASNVALHLCVRHTGED